MKKVAGVGPLKKEVGVALIIKPKLECWLNNARPWPEIKFLKQVIKLIRGCVSKK